MPRILWDFKATKHLKTINILYLLASENLSLNDKQFELQWVITLSLPSIFCVTFSESNFDSRRHSYSLKEENVKINEKEKTLVVFNQNKQLVWSSDYFRLSAYGLLSS